MKSNVIVDGYSIPTQVEEFVNANIIEVEAGTNGKQGGDSGHGCRTYIRIKNLASTDIRCEVNGKRIENANEVTITLGGDAELETMLDGLRFAVDTLENQIDKRRADVRLSNEEVGVLLQLIQPSIDNKSKSSSFAELCQSIKEKLERRFE